MSTPTPEQRLKFLEKSRAKKAQPDNKVDVLSRLEIAEGDKKKRKVETVGISVALLDKSSSPAAVVVNEATEAEGETHAKSPVEKKLRTFVKKAMKDKDTFVLEKDLQEKEDVMVETSPVVEENVAAVADQASGNSPWDPMFNPELFLERMVNMAGNSSRFNNTPTDELLRMTLGHELKGLLLNYAFAAR
jgi:hypothetical protein